MRPRGNPSVHAIRRRLASVGCRPMGRGRPTHEQAASRRALLPGLGARPSAPIGGFAQRPSPTGAFLSVFAGCLSVCTRHRVTNHPARPQVRTIHLSCSTRHRIAQHLASMVSRYDRETLGLCSLTLSSWRGIRSSIVQISRSKVLAHRLHFKLQRAHHP